MDILELLPQFMLYGFAALLAAIVFLAAWMIWGTYLSPAAPGIIVGYYRIFGCYAGGKLHKEISGRLVDATSYFVSPSTMARFKYLVIKSIEAKLQRNNPPITQEERKELMELLNRFRNYPTSKLSDLCRVIVTRERFTKHIFVQWKHVKPIEEYASTEEEHKFSFGFGPESKGIIKGDIYTFPEPWKNLGRVGNQCTVHLFKPHTTESPWEEPPEWLPRVLLYARPSVEADALLENMRQQLEQKDRTIVDLQEKEGAASTLADSMLNIVKGLGVETGEIDLGKLAAQKRLEVTDFILVAVPSFLGTYLAVYFNVDSYIGLIVGLCAGFALLYRRRKP